MATNTTHNDTIADLAHQITRAAESGNGRRIEDLTRQLERYMTAKMGMNRRDARTDSRRLACEAVNKYEDRLRRLGIRIRPFTMSIPKD